MRTSKLLKSIREKADLMDRAERQLKLDNEFELKRLRDFQGVDIDGLIFIGNISVNVEATTFEQKVRSAVMFRAAYGLGPVREGQSLRELEFENWCAGCQCRKFHLYPDDLTLAPLEAPDSFCIDTFTNDWQIDADADRSLTQADIDAAIADEVKP